jgi:ABC-type polysaccharide/polyol phosphate transport system ATPase subunit
MIRFEQVSKRFKLSAEAPQSVLDTLVSAFSRSGQRGKRSLWAVKDVSFDIKPHECLGLVGRNGSGKSTILKLASGIIRPSSGRVIIRGRLSALLELGAGFHPDLTGLENIWLNASILGLQKTEVTQSLDAIIEFSELGDYIHMPVKHYSSGMYMRLGFSVAVHVDPDVLLIDEILAVGDQSFQVKCIERLNELRDAGAAIIFVSHNLETVRSLCSRVLWIDGGKVREAGPAANLINRYQASHIHSSDDESGPTKLSDMMEPPPEIP